MEESLHVFTLLRHVLLCDPTSTSDEGAAIGTLYGSDHYTNSSDRDLPHDFADESHKPVEATLTTAFWPDELLLEEPFVL